MCVVVLSNCFIGALSVYYRETTMYMIRRQSIFLLLVTSAFSLSDAWGWGGAAHKFINQNAVQHLPPAMVQLAAQKVFLTDHASDADARKSSDPSEDPKHYIDLESYTDFQHLPADLSIVVAQYGLSNVQSYGILPWAIVATVDSLTAQFRRADWENAYQSAADLGHYVGDAYQPLHCTVNYNGGLTGNPGIHSQYETKMIGQYLSSLSVHPDSVSYVSDVYSLALSTTLHSNSYVDSIMQADDAARTASGWTGTTGTGPQLYYATLWERTGQFTRDLLQDATRDIASLWYTAWMNAGVSDIEEAPDLADAPSSFSLEQNYPNPFNPSTSIRFSIRVVSRQSPALSGVEGSVASNARLSVYDMLGREVAVLVNEEKMPGTYTATWDASGLASGMYIYRLQITGDGNEFTESKRMTLVR